MTAVSPATVVFSRPYRSGRELQHLESVLGSGHVHADGPFTRQASASLGALVGHDRVLLTCSGSTALEMACILLDLAPGDEVVVPSFTFATAATAVALRGAVPVFVDSDPHTGNIDPDAVTAAITERTRAISVMNYGGVGVDLPRLRAIADAHGLALLEDNAHGLAARSGGRALGTGGDLAVQSFHDTKNVQCGEGGALIVNRADLFERAEAVRQKGTDRSRFLRGEADKYTLVDVGSGFALSELSAAVLAAQLDELPLIQQRRHAIWNAYRERLDDWAREQGVELMSPGPEHEHPAHVFFLLTPDAASRTALLDHLHALGVVATFHYVPLHSSPGGRRFGRTSGSCAGATSFAERIVRLPLWTGLPDADVDRVVDAVTGFRVGAPR